MERDTTLEALVVEKFSAVSPVLDERGRRLWAAAESRSIGYGGDSLVPAATGLARETIRKGRREIERAVQAHGRVRRPGAGRPSMDDSQAGIREAREGMVDPLTRGDPSSPLRWTCKSRAKLAAALCAQGFSVSSTTVGRVLNELGHRLQSVRKSRAGASHPDRDAQFEHINATAAAFLADGQPVRSVDTKKKELVGDFRNAGREWQPSGAPAKVLVHDFPSEGLGKAIPYGVYDMARNEAWVSVGRDHDTPASRSPRLASGGARWAARPTPKPRRCTSPPMPAARMVTVRATSSTSCNGSLTRRGCAFETVTFRPAPASGTKSSTGCSVTSRRTGAANHCAALRDHCRSDRQYPHHEGIACQGQTGQAPLADRGQSDQRTDEDNLDETRRLPG